MPPLPKNPTPALGPSGLDPRAYGARPRRLRRLEPNPPVNIPQFSHWTFVFECRSPLPSEPVAVSVSDVSNALMTTATAADPVRDNAEAIVTDYESDSSSESSVPSIDGR